MRVLAGPVRLDYGVDRADSVQQGGVPLRLPVGRTRHTERRDIVVPQRVAVGFSLDDGNAPGSIRPTLRLTAQVSSRDKLNMFWDPSQFRFSDNVAIGGITGPAAGAPETGTVSGGTGWKQGTYGRLEQIRWTSTTTNRLLLEAGLGTYQQNWNGRERPGNNRDLIPVTEQCTAGCPTNGNLQNLTYRAQNWNTDFM